MELRIVNLNFYIMKKFLLFVLFTAIAVMSFGSEPLEPIPLSQPDEPITNGGPGGHRSPAYTEECPIQLYVDWDLLMLQFVGISSSDVVSYEICDSDEEISLYGFLTSTESLIDISSLSTGIYYIEVIYNGILYIAELTIA